MDSLKPTYQVITSAGLTGAADVVVSDKNLVIGPSSNASPKINLSQNANVFRQYPVNETAAVYTYTPAATLAPNTTYGFTLFQNVDGIMRKVVVEYTSGASAPANATALCDLLRTALTKYINTGKIKVSGSGTSTVVVTGAAGYPLFQMSAVQAGTSAQTLPAAVSGTTITTGGVATATSHGFSSGDLVSITGATGATFIRNGVSTSTAISNVPIYVINANSFLLLGVTVSVAASASSFVKQPANSAGQYADVLAETTDQVVSVAPVSGRKYAKYVIEYANPVSSLNSMSRYQEGTHIVFVDSYFDALAASTNFTAFDAAITNVVNGVTSGTTANAELLATPNTNN